MCSPSGYKNVSPEILRIDPIRQKDAKENVIPTQSFMQTNSPKKSQFPSKKLILFRREIRAEICVPIGGKRDDFDLILIRPAKIGQAGRSTAIPL
jgi:hypothetical protein